MGSSFPDMSQTEPTVRQARDRFFADSGFSPDGGYADEWAEADFGAVRYRVPNLPARRAALQRHDLHHVVTGYASDWRGEAEISGWELGSGAGWYPYAWLIALWGVFTGLIQHPGPTVKAFLRGRHSTNLYRYEASTEAILEQPVSTLRESLSVLSAGADPWQDRSVAARAADVLALAGWSTASMLLGLISILPAGVLLILAWRPQLPALTGFSCCPCRASAA